MLVTGNKSLPSVKASAKTDRSLEGSGEEITWQKGRAWQRSLRETTK